MLSPLASIDLEHKYIANDKVFWLERAIGAGLIESRRKSGGGRKDSDAQWYDFRLGATFYTATHWHFNTGYERDRRNVATLQATKRSKWYRNQGGFVSNFERDARMSK